jgi:hypothetical protein
MVLHFSFWKYDIRLKLFVYKWTFEIEIFGNEIRLWKKYHNFGVAILNSYNLKAINRIK